MLERKDGMNLLAKLHSNSAQYFLYLILLYLFYRLNPGTSKHPPDPILNLQTVLMFLLHICVYDEYTHGGELLDIHNTS